MQRIKVARKLVCFFSVVFAISLEATRKALVAHRSSQLVPLLSGNYSPLNSKIETLPCDRGELPPRSGMTY